MFFTLVAVGGVAAVGVAGIMWVIGARRRRVARYTAERSALLIKAAQMRELGATAEADALLSQAEILSELIDKDLRYL